MPPLLGPPVPARDGLASIEDGDDYDLAPTLTALWQINDQWRLGVGWLGERTLDFNSDLSISLPGPGGGTGPENVAADVEVVFPQVVGVSAGWYLNEQFLLTARVGWEEWSQLDSVPISTSATGAAIPTEWDDVWSFAVGMRYDPAGPWRWYSGVAYDTDPAEDRYRVPVLPVDEQLRLSGGLTYDLDSGSALGLSISWIELGDAGIENESDAGVFSGSYDENRLIVVGLNYAF